MDERFESELKTAIRAPRPSTSSADGGGVSNQSSEYASSEAMSTSCSAAISARRS